MVYNEIVERGTSNFPIELYCLDKRHPRYEMSSHWHGEIEIIKVTCGKLDVKLNSNEYIATENDIIIVNPQTIHGAIPRKGCLYECIVLNLDMLNIVVPDCRAFIDGLIEGEILINEFNSNAPPDFFLAVKSLFDSMKSKKYGFEFYVIGALYNLFGSIIDNNMYASNSVTDATSENKNNLKLKEIISYIRENYQNHITLADMAKRVNMSQKYFCSFFKKMTRKTPMEYLILYRIECAGKKLKNTDISVTEIAMICGFNDLSYFIKKFKQIKGVTPRHFRH